MPLLRRRPLLRAAAVGGGAYMMGKRRAESQGLEAQQESEQDQRLSSLESQQAPAPAAPVAQASAGLAPGAIDQLKELGQLKQQGILTDEEFEAQKAKILGG